MYINKKKNKVKIFTEKKKKNDYKTAPALRKRFLMVLRVPRHELLYGGDGLRIVS